MRTEVRAKLHSIFGYPFLENVGGLLPSSVTKISNWDQAEEECTKPKWEKCRLMARNALQRNIEQCCWKRSNDWNLLADELRSVVVSFVEKTLQKSLVPQKIANKIRNKLTWDLMFICMEREFEDVVDPLFYLSQLDPWYAAGHFPCGWDGQEFPDGWDGVIKSGKLMVF